MQGGGLTKRRNCDIIIQRGFGNTGLKREAFRLGQAAGDQVRFKPFARCAVPFHGKVKRGDGPGEITKVQFLRRHVAQAGHLVVLGGKAAQAVACLGIGARRVGQFAGPVAG